MVVNFYKVLYVIIHGIYTLFNSINTLLVKFNVRVQGALYEFLPKSEKSKYFETRLKRLTKKPKHLTVLLGEEENQLKDIAHLILWCMKAQIPFISFYDYKGKLRKYTEELQYEVSLQKGEHDHIIWYTDQQSSYKNGYIGNKIYVKIINEENGRESVVNLVKNLALQNIKTIDMAKTNDSLNKEYQFPDPDMGLVCNKVFMFFSYSPWQIRLTEFFRLNTVKDITLPMFLDLLKRYSKCEQRLGK